MGPSCRNPWAYFQFYRNVELIIMEAYNLRAGMTFVVIRSSSDILEVSKSWMISSSPSIAYWNLAPELRPVTTKPFSHPCRREHFSWPQNPQIILCWCSWGLYLTLHYVLVVCRCEVGGLGSISDSLLYSWLFLALYFVNHRCTINLHAVWYAGATLSRSRELTGSS